MNSSCKFCSPISGLATILLFAILSLWTSNVDAQTSTALRPKNIVLIMLDDADYFDFGFTQIENSAVARDAVTPHMNTLRAQGRLFSQFRTASAVC